jgi:hypothetical protein
MRLGVLVLGGSLALPAAAAAQVPGGFATERSADLVPYTRFAVTPWIGLRLGHGSGEYYATTGTDQYRVTEARGGGPAIGVNFEAQVTGPLSFIAGAAYSASDQDDLVFETVGGGTARYRIDGPAVLFAKAGVQYRIPDPVPDSRRFHPAAFVSIAPAVVVADWPGFDGYDADVTGRTTNFAVNLAFDAVTSIGSRGLALSLGLEDYITFWNRGRIRIRDEILLGDLLEGPVLIDYDTRASNLLMLRIGGSWRF